MARFGAFPRGAVLWLVSLGACGGGAVQSHCDTGGMCPGTDDPGSDGSGGDGTPTDPGEGPAPGNPEGRCAVPEGGGPADSSRPDQVVGTGTKESCTSAAFVAAVAQGGVITFDCGPDPVTIELDETAKVFNDRGPDIVLDGGGKITLSGKNQRRILYQNTCDEAQRFTTPRCDNQDHPRLTVQNITFVDGNAGSDRARPEGGAIYAQGGRLKIVNARFFHNQGEKTGQDAGGGAVRAFMQYEGLPVFVTASTFGGPEAALGNEASNGGALSSIGVSWTITNSHFANNRAVGDGGNPAKPSTVGGGSGGAIYNDGNTFTLSLCGTVLENNSAREYGGAIFFVSNDRSGHMVVRDSVLRNNASEDAVADQYPGIFILERGEPEFLDTVLE